nr:thioredoxin domain-containing protein [Actinomycetales bacterium]
MARAEETPRLSKQERRERAREEARRIREEQARREKRNRRLMIGGTLALMAIMAVVVTLVVINSGKSPLEGVAAPEGSDEHGGISASTSLSVEPGEGEPVRVDVYSDYTCSWCEVFEQLHAQQIVELSESGQAEFWIHPVATLDGTGDFSGYSGLAVNASATVAQHAPEQWLDFHAALFTPYSDA